MWIRSTLIPRIALLRSKYEPFDWQRWQKYKPFYLFTLNVYIFVGSLWWGFLQNGQYFNRNTPDDELLYYIELLSKSD